MGMLAWWSTSKLRRRPERAPSLWRTATWLGVFQDNAAVPSSFSVT